MVANVSPPGIRLKNAKIPIIGHFIAKSQNMARIKRLFSPISVQATHTNVLQVIWSCIAFDGILLGSQIMQKP